MAKEDGGWSMENGGGRWRWPTPDMLGYVSQPPAKGGVPMSVFPWTWQCSWQMFADLNLN